MFRQNDDEILTFGSAETSPMRQGECYVDALLCSLQSTFAEIEASRFRPMWVWLGVAGLLITNRETELTKDRMSRASSPLAAVKMTILPRSATPLVF